MVGANVLQCALIRGGPSFILRYYIETMASPKKYRYLSHQIFCTCRNKFLKILMLPFSMITDVLIDTWRDLFPQVTRCHSLAATESCVREFLPQFQNTMGKGCILFLYSAVLSRGTVQSECVVDNHLSLCFYYCPSTALQKQLAIMLFSGISTVRADMDEPGSCLMANHGYCSQELVNLVMMGYAGNYIVLDPFVSLLGDCITASSILPIKMKLQYCHVIEINSRLATYCFSSKCFQQHNWFGR